MTFAWLLLSFSIDFMLVSSATKQGQYMSFFLIFINIILVQLFLNNALKYTIIMFMY